MQYAQKQLKTFVQKTMSFLKVFVDKWVDIGYNKNVPKRDTKIL